MSDPSTNFGEAAARYTAFRPDYPPTLFEFLLRYVTSGQSNAVDLGAGSGQATQSLATLFDTVTAIEPDARLAADAQFPANARTEVKAAEDAAFEAESVDAVISATAFHWMDQVLICNNVVQWLKPGGAFFPFAYDAFSIEGAARDYFAEEFSKWASYRDPRLLDCYDYERALNESGVFKNVIPYAQEMRHEIPSSIAAGLISTFSFAREYARDVGGDGYFENLRAHLESFGETVTFLVPVIGALGVKG